MLGASGRRRARRKSQFGSCVPAQQDVQASTVAVDEAQIIRLIGRVAPRRACRADRRLPRRRACNAKDHRSGPAAEELRVVALANDAKVRAVAPVPPDPPRPRRCSSRASAASGPSWSL